MGEFVPYVGRNWVVGSREPRSYAHAKAEREALWLQEASDVDLRWKLYYIWREAAGRKLRQPLLERFFNEPAMTDLVALLRTKGVSHLKEAARTAAVPSERRLVLAEWLETARNGRGGAP